jgi:two-component system, response regulator YesN
MPINGICRFTRVELEFIDHSITFIKQHFFKPITAAQLADDFNVNIRKLQAGFRKKTGSTVHDYLLKVRLEEAKNLLMDPDELVKSIALNTGFSSSSHFGQVFKERFGLTPQEYRLEQIPAEMD